MRASNLLSRKYPLRLHQKPEPEIRQSQITGLKQQLSDSLIGQPAAIDAIVPSVQMFQAGLAPEGRPAGVFLLLGPSGTGKTRTVEVLSAALHGCERQLLRVDCGEFQMEHEVAKLIGAPPGYLGHRETPPLLTQQKVNGASSHQCGLSIILFDEIEKAAPSLTRLLLGVLDKAILHLGDNTSVNFERTLIFMTSNVGSAGISRILRQDFGFPAESLLPDQMEQRLARTGMHAVRKAFPPEFVNRIDSVVTYQPLQPKELSQILEMQIDSLQAHLDDRLGERSCVLVVPPRSRKALLQLGTSAEYGARELKRTLHRHLMQPIAAMIADERIQPGAKVILQPDGITSFRLRVRQAS